LPGQRSLWLSVDIAYPDPTRVVVTPFSVTRRALHPYAAAFLVDDLLSDAGLEIFAALRMDRGGEENRGK